MVKLLYDRYRPSSPFPDACRRPQKSSLLIHDCVAILPPSLPPSWSVNAVSAPKRSLPSSVSQRMLLGDRRLATSSRVHWLHGRSQVARFDDGKSWNILLTFTLCSCFPFMFKGVETRSRPHEGCLRGRGNTKRDDQRAVCHLCRHSTAPHMLDPLGLAPRGAS